MVLPKMVGIGAQLKSRPLNVQAGLNESYYSVVYLFILETGFYCVILAGLELAM